MPMKSLMKRGNERNVLLLDQHNQVLKGEQLRFKVGGGGRRGGGEGVGWGGWRASGERRVREVEQL